jgi:drug/metabolite transporter (DMT)-like permease
MNNRKPLQAHLSMFTAAAIWGLMAPLGKDAMNNGLDGISMVSFRVLGAALLFWVASIFVKAERVPRRDIFLFAGAGLFGIVFNQCLYTIGLSFTSPVNASIVTTSMPIFAMILSFFILKEPITLRKAGGVFAGCCGAVILILTSMSAADSQVGDFRGDLMCMAAQVSFALYLSLFNHLIKRYSVVTVNKWMFTWSAVMILPFTTNHIVALPWADIPVKTWLETGYVVFFGTFVSYLLSITGQRVLRPTVVSVYNYVQPIVSVAVTVLMGLGVFTWPQGIAIILVFTGVWLVVKSKSRREQLGSNPELGSK